MTTTQKTRKKRKAKVRRPITIESWGNGFNIEISRKLSNDMKSMQQLSHELIDYLAQRDRLKDISGMLKILLEAGASVIAEEYLANFVRQIMQKQESKRKHAKAAKKKKTVKSKRAKAVD